MGRRPKRLWTAAVKSGITFLDVSLFSSGKSIKHLLSQNKVKKEVLVNHVPNKAKKVI